MNVLMMHIVALQHNGQREQRSYFHLYKTIQYCLLVFKFLTLCTGNCSRPTGAVALSDHRAEPLSSEQGLLTALRSSPVSYR